MNNIQKKSVTLHVSRIHPDGWWLGNGEEHVAAGTALGADCTENIYEPSTNGVIGKYDHQLNIWLEIEDKSAYEFWAPNGDAFVIGVPDGDYPEWAVKDAPPKYDKEIQTVIYKDGKWKVFGILLGETYWDSETNEFVISDYNFTLPDKHSFTKPPKAKEGFAVRLVNNQWKQLEDYRGKVIYNWNDCTKSELVEELGKIKEGFTFDEPKTLYDEWNDHSWVTNQSNKYIADYNQVDETRRGLYAYICDSLIAEANVKRLQGKKQEAEDMEIQALAARSKIQESNPFPKL